MPTIGTHVFIDINSAVKFYRRQGFLVKDVHEKIQEGEIGIGRDYFEENFPEKEYIIDRDGRFHII